MVVRWVTRHCSQRMRREVVKKWNERQWSGSAARWWRQSEVGALNARSHDSSTSRCGRCKIGYGEQNGQMEDKWGQASNLDRWPSCSKAPLCHAAFALSMPALSTTSWRGGIAGKRFSGTITTGSCFSRRWVRRAPGLAGAFTPGC
jgi:hypothetical protein